MPPSADERAQRVGERLLAGRVDAGGRLVEHEQFRLAGQRAGDERALLLAAGEGATGSRGPVGEPDGGQRGVDRGPVGGRPGGRSSPGGPAGRTATTSRTVAGTPLPAPRRCGTYPIRRHCRNRRSGVPNRCDRPSTTVQLRPSSWGKSALR